MPPASPLMPASAGSKSDSDAVVGPEQCDQIGIDKPTATEPL